MTQETTMGSELPTRTADPTLAALRDKRVLLDASAPTPVAHNSRGTWGGPACMEDFPGRFERFPARHACWFAVPCRECFPGAPLPGRRPSAYGAKVDPGLAWQRQEET